MRRLTNSTDNLRIPTKPAMHSNLKPATCSDPKPGNPAAALSRSFWPMTKNVTRSPMAG
jgi:hypothetical protein